MTFRPHPRARNVGDPVVVRVSFWFDAGSWIFRSHGLNTANVGSLCDVSLHSATGCLCLHGMAWLSVNDDFVWLWQLPRCPTFDSVSAFSRVACGGDSLISVVAHEFEVRLSSDQRDALRAPGHC